MAPNVVLLDDRLAKIRLHDFTVALKPALIFEYRRVLTRPLHRLSTLVHEISDSIRKQVSAYNSVPHMHR